MPPDYETTASSGEEPPPPQQQQQQQQQKRSRKSSKEQANQENSQKQIVKKVDEEKSAKKELPSYTINQKEHGGLMVKTGKVVSITSTQFELESVMIFEGESITFQLHPEAEYLISEPIQQVYKTEKSYTPVFGGYGSQKLLQTTQTWMQEFNHATEYFFQFASHVPLKVIVKPKPDSDVTVTDQGFSKPLIRIYKGDTVRWVWQKCSILHTITEAKYCINHSGYKTIQQHSSQTYSGTYFETFTTAGIYYFQTDIYSKEEENEKATCVVQVLEKKREHFIELKNDGFSRSIFDIQKGERVWIHWKQSKSPASEQTVHSVVIRRTSQMGVADNTDISDVIVEDKSEPSISGLMSYVFPDVGVFEICDKETHLQKCVVLVKATVKQHVVRITKEEFSPGIM